MANKILVDGEDFGNRGFMAITAGLTKSLREYIPDVEIVVFSTTPSRYCSLAKPYLQIQRIPWAWPQNERSVPAMARLWVSYGMHYSRCLILRTAGKFARKAKGPYEDYRLVIHYIADWPSESDSRPLKTIPSLLWLLAMCMLFNRPVCLVPSGMGPFRTKYTRAIAKFVLNRTRIVALRDPISHAYVEELNLTGPSVVLCGDMAFLLDPADHSRVNAILRTEGIVKGSKPLVGICPNQRNGRILGLDPATGRLRYVQVIASLADYLSEKLDVVVCLIPHVYDFGDKDLCRQIQNTVKPTTDLRLLTGEYPADELKGIIGECDMFVGNWMHSTVAATSMGVPTLAIAFGDKFHRLIGHTMGQEQYVVDLKGKSSSGLLAEIMKKIDDLWVNREAVRQELAVRTKVVQERAWSYGKLISELEIPGDAEV